MQLPAPHRLRRLSHPAAAFLLTCVSLVALPHGHAEDSDKKRATTTNADPCPSKTPKGKWKTLPQPPEMPKPKPPRARSQDDGGLNSVWHDGRLWVFASDNSGASLDLCNGEWTQFPNEDLSPPSSDALGDEPRLDVRGAFGAYDADLMTASTKITRGPGGVELYPGSYVPRAYFGLDTFAGAKLRIDGGQWIDLPEENAPTPRRKSTYAVVKMDRKVAIWGGETESGPTNTGALFDLDKKTWSPMSTKHAPSARRHVKTVTWTGDKLILWGGRTNQGEVFDGGVYDLSKDTWTPMATKGAPEGAGEQYVAVWSGTHLVYFATHHRWSEAKGAAYDLGANTWTELKAPNRLYPTYKIRSWRAGGGKVLFAAEDGPWMGFLDPSTGKWTSLPWKTTGLPGRQSPNFHWTGQRLIVWGGVLRKVVHPGGGCEGPRPPNTTCDPVSPIISTTPRLDGAIYRPK